MFTNKYIVATIHIPIEIHTNQFIPFNERCRIEFEYKENIDEYPINHSLDQKELISKFTQFFAPEPPSPPPTQVQENTLIYHRKPPGKQKTFKNQPVIRRKVYFTAKNRDAIMKLIEN